jgi:hypothetical protein
MPVFWGVMILAGLGALLIVRRRDWKAHWQALEAQHPAPPPRDESDPPPA